MSFESPKQYTPKETVEDRPDVFSSESFPVVMNFAGRFNRLLIPKSSEEEQPKKFDDVLTLRELRARVEECTNTATREQLADLLTEISPFQKEDNESIIGAAADKEFDEVNKENSDIKTTALGTALVAERARATNMKRALENLPQETLERFGMSSREQEIIVLLLNTITKINAEYMRIQVHTREKTPLKEKPRDTLREKRFISENLSRIEEKMLDTAKGGEATFGSLEKDEAFLGYILKLKNVYDAFEEGGALPVSFKEQLDRMEDAQESFTAFHSQFPDFPLIVFPAFEHYDADEAAEESGGTGENMVLIRK